MNETWQDRFNALLCEYLNEEHGLDASRVISTDSDFSEGCDTCGYNSGWSTWIAYLDKEGIPKRSFLEVDLTKLFTE